MGQRSFEWGQTPSTPPAKPIAAYIINTTSLLSPRSKLNSTPSLLFDVKMEQTRALNALEPFLALSKSATSPRAASDLVVQATSAPNTYVFAELLQTPNIQALRSSEEYAPYLTLLEIFAWGTWEDYKSTYMKPLTTRSSN